MFVFQAVRSVRCLLESILGAIRILSKHSEALSLDTIQELSKSYLDTIWRYPNFGFKAAEETGVIRRNPRLLFLCRDLLSYSFLCDLDLIQTATSSLNPSLWFSECKPLIQRFFQMLRDLPLHPRLYCDHYRRPEERHYENVLSFLFAIFIVISGANNG